MSRSARRSPSSTAVVALAEIPSQRQKSRQTVTPSGRKPSPTPHARVGDVGEDAWIVKLTEAYRSPAAPSGILDTTGIPPIGNRHRNGVEAERDPIIRGIGDDAALLRGPSLANGEQHWAITCDTLTDGVHFRLGWFHPQRRFDASPYVNTPVSGAFLLGVKAACVNLSDLAAMNARPTALLVAMVCPPVLSAETLTDFARGLGAASTYYGAQVVGGDTTRGPVFSITVTALGLVAPHETLRRDRGRAGDLLLVSGNLGQSAAGLHHLERGHAAKAPTLPFSEWEERAMRAQLAPIPQFIAARAAVDTGVVCGMDVSDGLCRDAARLARASSRPDCPLVAVIDADAVAAGAAQTPGISPPSKSARKEPPTPMATVKAATDDPLVQALTGGEDYALLVAAPSTVAEALVRNGAFHRVGHLVAAQEAPCSPSPLTLENGTVRIVGRHAAPLSDILGATGGYDAFPKTRPRGI